MWQPLHKGINCPRKFWEANQQTCPQCQNYSMLEQNYIHDYAHDAHPKREFHQWQIYDRKPKEKEETNAINETDITNAPNETNVLGINTINEIKSKGEINVINNHAHF